MSDELTEIVKATAVIGAKFDSHEKQDESRFSYVADAFKEVRSDLKKQSWFLTLIIGGLIALSRLPDFLSLVHKANANGITN